MTTFNYKNETWNLRDTDGVTVTASRVGKRGRPSKFTVAELTAAGVDLTGVSAPVVQDTPVLDNNEQHDPQPAETGDATIELPF